MTDQEVTNLQNSYSSDGIRLWVTDQSDIEAEFCDPAFLSSLTGEALQTCEIWIQEILNQNQAPISQQFASQRAAHNQELYKAGGSPTNDEVWNAFQALPLKGAKGKYVFGQLKNKVPGNKFSEPAIAALGAYPERAAKLKQNLIDLIS